MLTFIYHVKVVQYLMKFLCGNINKNVQTMNDFVTHPQVCPSEVSNVSYTPIADNLVLLLDQFALQRLIH